MRTPEAGHPFPDYVACPTCGEPEVEVWCYQLQAKCHACGQMFEHARPDLCRTTCVIDPDHPDQVSCT